MTDLTADLTRICDTDNAQADHAPASVARALYLQRRVTALEQQNHALRVRAEIAEAAADAAVDARWFMGTQADADDALLAYEYHHGRTVPGISRDGWIDE